MFKGKITAPVLDAICVAYGTGDPDPVEPGSFVKVRSELFATDFDDIPLPGDPGAVVMPARWRDAMIDLRDAAGNKQLDLTDAFSEYSGTGREAQIGIMPKDRFRSAMGVLFAGIRLEKALLDAICDAYGTGVPDRRGGLSKVQGTPPPPSSPIWRRWNGSWTSSERSSTRLQAHNRYPHPEKIDSPRRF